MGPINLMKYICVTEIIHLNFGRSEMFLFGIQGRGAFLGYITKLFTETRCLLNVLGDLWHFAFIVRPYK